MYIIDSADNGAAEMLSVQEVGQYRLSLNVSVKFAGTAELTESPSFYQNYFFFPLTKPKNVCFG